MGSNALGFCILTSIFIITIPDLVFSKTVIHLQEKITVKRRKRLWVGGSILALVVCAGISILPILFVTNRIYKTKIEVVTLIESEENVYGEKLRVYWMQTKDENTGKWGYMVNVYSDKIEEGDVIEVRKFWGSSFVVKINGKEMLAYKKYYKGWLGNPNGEKIILTLALVFNCFMQILRYQRRKKIQLSEKKTVFCVRTWNWGCIIFTLLMSVCIWRRIDNSRECHIWGYLLLALYVIYQISGYIFCMKNAQSFTKEIKVAYVGIKAEYVKESTMESVKD